jgi:flagellar motor switch protein FliN/FliY
MPETPSPRWFDELAAQLGEVLEPLTGTHPLLTIDERAPAAPGPVWRVPFSGVATELWIAASAEAAATVATVILEAAGLPDADAATQGSTWNEFLGQLSAGLARRLGPKNGREVTAGPPAAVAQPPERNWRRVALTLGSREAEFFVAFTPERLPESAGEGAPRPDAAPETKSGRQPVDPRISRSQTLELLLDVELPVRISFGRAMLRLKDIVKLTTGSIVELNRSVTEPVDVIVNNCVVARGEVVVVGGYFAIRIAEVISRDERLRVLA